MKTIIIGGGPAGIISAIASSKKENEVILIEKENSLGKKLLITGKGRCNITSSLPINEFIENIPGNGRFLYSAFQNFSNKDIIDLLNKSGLKVKEERGNRIFPVTDKAEDVLKALTQNLKKENIQVKLNTKAVEILTDGEKVIGVVCEKDNEKQTIMGDKVILATGGRSYPLTGSDGSGYIIAQKLGHTIIPQVGSIVPMTAEKKKCENLQGLSLKNVKILIKDTQKDKKIYEDFGEMLFTHFGVSGPTILSASAHVIRYKNVYNLLKENKIKLIIDLKPALTEEKLDFRIRRDFEELKNKQFKNSLDKLLPKKMINEIIVLSKINPEKQVNTVTKEERRNLVKLLKNFEVTLTGFRPIEEAIITAGGISIKEINPKTMESKKINGLYFAGEIIDVDAYTGGFNLQIAYSTGYTAGIN